jgi:hypothetical protein
LKILNFSHSMITDQNRLDAFVAEARRFCHWASGDDGSSASAREALRRTAHLYSAALELPRPDTEGLASDGADVEVPPKSLQQVAKRAAELPINFYGETIDPLMVPPGETGLGSTVDDVGDIYLEIARGLMLYDLGRAVEALWEWRFGFQTHWGKHATGLLRALHYYLAQNDPDGLSRAERARGH